ncbi:hypothetical protein ACFVIM_06970 [Streptomyces sp. NPDC057638]|uniref:hypothetical protein n=1 Tax=Streptomyces sp. NPDC057638 TaxID=3346190 RepID=UPI0036BEFA1E
MHMNRAPHLLTEDRAEFQRILDEALRNTQDRPELAAIGERLNATQLRTMALNATAMITSAAAAEYDHYLRIREETLSQPHGGPAGPVGGTAPSGDGPPRRRGAGLLAVTTVLVPVLAATAAVILLLVGYLLKMLSPTPSFAGTLVTVGWFFAAVTAAGILVAAMGLLLTAVRNSSTQVPAQEPMDELPDEVARAKDAWLHAVLERGIVPFLHGVLEDPHAHPLSQAPPRPVERTATEGYDGPDYSGPDEGGSPGQRPSFTSPDFTSKEFGGGEGRPE